MEKIRDFEDQQAWRRGSLILLLVGNRLHVHSDGVRNGERDILNVEISPDGITLLAGTPERFMQALLSLTLEDPPAALAGIATKASAYFAGHPIGSRSEIGT